MIPALWELTDHAVNTIGLKNVPVIWSDQNVSRQQKPYVLLNYNNDDAPNFDYLDKVDVPGWRRLSSWRKAVVDLQIYFGHNSLSLANYVAMAFASESSLLKQNELNVSIGNRLFLARVPEMLNTSQWEDRAIYHFDFYYTETFDEWVSWIGAVEITSTTTGGRTDILTDEDGNPIPTPSCKGIVMVEKQFTNWDAFTTPWDKGRTIWDDKE